MTVRKTGGTLSSSVAVTQNYSSYVLLAETKPVSGTTNSVSGMTNPVMINGTSQLTFNNAGVLNS